MMCGGLPLDQKVGYRSTKKTVYSANYHIIWCSKYRRRVLAGSL
jgi:REP element-mobilizing transposase RayT